MCWTNNTVRMCITNQNCDKDKTLGVRKFDFYFKKNRKETNLTLMKNTAAMPWNGVFRGEWGGLAKRHVQSITQTPSKLQDEKWEMAKTSNGIAQGRTPEKPQRGNPSTDYSSTSPCPIVVLTYRKAHGNNRMPRIRWETSVRDDLWSWRDFSTPQKMVPTKFKVQYQW